MTQKLLAPATHGNKGESRANNGRNGSFHLTDKLTLLHPFPYSTQSGSYSTSSENQNFSVQKGKEDFWTRENKVQLRV